MIEWGESAAAKAGPVPLVFLFGAGASHGAIGVTPYPPPLGCDLYEALAEQFPKTWGVASQFAGVADKFKKDFEAAMEQYSNEHSATAVVSALNDMARYFATFDPDGTDLYSKLLLELKARSLIAHTVFSSLNYDCVFEKAARRLRYRVHYEGIDSAPVVPGDVRVIKPHGSCNFLTSETDQRIRAILFTGSTVEAGIEAQNPESVCAALETRTRWAVMSNYASNKITPLSPAQITQVRNGFAARLASAVKIIVIGARPNDHDTHVWAPLRDCGKEVLYVGGDYASLCISRSRLLGLTFEGAWASLLGELDAIAPNFTNYPERVAERR